MNKIVLRDSIYIPIKDVSDEDVAKHYVKHFYDERVCRACPEKKNRFSDACANCELGGHLGTANLVKKKTINGVHCYGIPIGDRLNVERKLGIDFDDYKIVDKRTRCPIDKRIKFLAPLRDYQIKIQKDWLTAKHGIIKAPPRSGKTITSLSLCIALGQRFAIIADQKDFLDNFKEELEQHSNILSVQAKSGKPIYGFLKTKEDFYNYQIGFVTYQSFISDKNGKKKLKWLNENFGTIWTDEIHRGNADAYAKFISNVASRYKGGCTATPERKDKKHVILEDLVGPVVAEATVEAMNPLISLHLTGVHPKNKSTYTRGPAAWTNANKFLAVHPERNKYILRGILNDLEKGRSIVMAVMFTDQVKNMVNMINSAVGKNIAVGFVGGGGEKNKKARKQIIDDARVGKIRVVVGIRKLMQLGLNVPRWDTLYLISPISNEPNWQQESRRICTPMEGKKRPVIRIFVETEMPIPFGCFKNTLKHSKGFGYQLSKRAKKILSELNLNNARKDRDHNDEGLYDSERYEQQDNKKQKQKQNMVGGFISRFGSLK
jgi:superfamily II DNA or RNA helicase